MSNQMVFESVDKAIEYSFTIPWKIDVCHVGEECWCRLILPIEPIKYTHTYSTGEKTEVDYESIIPDGSVDKDTAEYIVKIHNERIEKNVSDN
jgi:hypothetical protein